MSGIKPLSPRRPLAPLRPAPAARALAAEPGAGARRPIDEFSTTDRLRSESQKAVSVLAHLGLDLNRLTAQGLSPAEVTKTAQGLIAQGLSKPQVGHALSELLSRRRFEEALSRLGDLPGALAAQDLFDAVTRALPHLENLDCFKSLGVDLKSLADRGLNLPDIGQTAIALLEQGLGPRQTGRVIASMANGRSLKQALEQVGSLPGRQSAAQLTEVVRGHLPASVCGSGGFS
jgi:hypothetical protein